MQGAGQAIAAAVAFVGTHFLLLYPLRRRVAVDRLILNRASPAKAGAQ